jgi:hypothetical protein
MDNITNICGDIGNLKENRKPNKIFDFSKLKVSTAKRKQLTVQLRFPWSGSYLGI